MADPKAGIPEHLIGEFYNMPDAPPFGVKEEKDLIDQIKEARDAVLSLLPHQVGDKITVEDEVKGEKKKFTAVLGGVIIGQGSEVNIYTYIYRYEVEAEKNGKKVKETREHKITKKLAKTRKTKQYAKVLAKYENERHKFALRYSFAVNKISSNLCNQCHCGMGYDDLCQVGFAGIMNAIDKWPPFLGVKDKGARLLTSVRKTVHNATCRFLDDHNRRIKVPSYKIDQITVRLKSEDIYKGKKGKNNKRKKPGKFELGIQAMAKELELEPADIDGKSLKEIAIETSRYRVVAKAACLDIASFISIIMGTATSIDMPLNEDCEDSVADMIPYEEYDSEHAAFQRDSLEEALDQLTIDNRRQGMKNPERSAQVIRDHFFGGMSIREISEKYKKEDGSSISPMRASDLIEKSINRIRNCEAAINILTHKVVGR